MVNKERGERVNARANFMISRNNKLFYGQKDYMKIMSRRKIQ